MDGQHQEHGESYAYSSLEWPEFYDLWVEEIFGTGPAEDAIVFQEVLQSLMNIPPSGQEITVLDLGTGTGRVIQDLSLAIAVRNDTPRTGLIGIDHSKSMLERARGKFRELWSKDDKQVDEPQWLLGSAADFAHKLPHVAHQIDVLIFAAGGVSHLTADGETESFLQQVKIALRPNDRSVAIVSVLHEFILAANSETLEPLQGNQVPEEEVKISSRDYPGLMYIKPPTIITYDDNVRTDRFSVTATRVTTESQADRPISVPTVVWQKDMAWSVKGFKEDAWNEEIRSAGLETDSVKEGAIQRFYVIKHRSV